MTNITNVLHRLYKWHCTNGYENELLAIKSPRLWLHRWTNCGLQRKHLSATDTTRATSLATCESCAD